MPPMTEIHAIVLEDDWKEITSISGAMSSASLRCILVRTEEDLTRILASTDRIDCVIVQTCADLESLLEGGATARLVFLDDRVPPSMEENQCDHYFLSRTGPLVTKTLHDATNFYTGSCPGSQDEKFCAEQGFTMLRHKQKIARTIIASLNPQT